MGKVAKYPHIEDYRECIRDMDEKQAITMRYIIMEIRNHYVSVNVYLFIMQIKSFSFLLINTITSNNLEDIKIHYCKLLAIYAIHNNYGYHYQGLI